MATSAPNLRPDELPDYPFVGPFGGIQSEVPVNQIGRSGFLEVQNILFRKSGAQPCPAFTALASPDGGKIVGIGDFFNVNGLRRFVVWTDKGSMFYYNSGVWVQVTGVLHGNAAQFMQWDVVGYKLYFSQNQDVVQVWDGITAGFASSTCPVPAKYVCEIDTHLVIANTIEGGVPAPNRVRWSGIGDGTDWASFSSGQNDLFNGLGPINGLARIYQAGYAFQQWGVTQIVPTGIGLAPFQFIPMGSRAKGSIMPYAVASFGEIVACYVGKNDVYLFDGTESQGIGSRPIDGNRRLGARGRIFTDLFTAVQTNVFGFILTSANGNDYESYWLLIPGLNKAWVYHFDEGSWTQEFFNAGQLLGPVGVAPLQTVPRIMDLVGSIQAQSWTPSGLSNANELDTMAISDASADSVSYLNFGQAGSTPTSGSINPTDGWYIKSGQLTFDDSRHSHTAKKVRICVIDQGANTIYTRWTNEKGQTESHTIAYGNGSGLPMTLVQGLNLPGKYITFELSGPPGVFFDITEIAPVYDTGGEVQAGNR